MLLDVHASHRHKDVIDWASRNDIGLTLIPAGQTDVWQPLDRKIFGSLKKRSMLMISEDMITETPEQHNTACYFYPCSRLGADNRRGSPEGLGAS